MSRIILALALACSASAFMVPGKAPRKLATGVRQQGQSPPLGSAQDRLLRLLRLWAAQHSPEEAGPLGAQPLPRLLERPASRTADSTAFGLSGPLIDGGH